MKFIKLNPDAIIPRRGSAQSAGYDLHAYKNYEIKPGELVLIETGIAWEKEPTDVQIVGFIWPRSGLAVKKLADTFAGVIDMDYTQEIKVAFVNYGNETIFISEGDRIAQLIIQKFELVSNDGFIIQKRESGFGSTGS
jgi:dUTP pyrophosphatase